MFLQDWNTFPAIKNATAASIVVNSVSEFMNTYCSLTPFRGCHREASLMCSREMVIIWHLSFRNVSMLSCVTKIIPKRLSVLPVYCDWSLLIY
jgi:hypothetical protein